MKRMIILVLLIFISLWTDRTSMAGTVTFDLANKIATSSADDKIPVVIAMKDEISAPVLKKELLAGFATAAARHLEGISRLQNEASKTQEPLLGLLNTMAIAGSAANIKSHWLINVITADIAASEIDRLAARSDVAEIFQLPQIVGIKPDSAVAVYAEKIAIGPTNNLKKIKADSAWAKGYTGKGRIICSFDTGVQGSHPALEGNWKGWDGNPAAAWYDPIGRQSFPHTLSVASDPSHGTETMGIMVGHDDVEGDTVGVAPDAKWISAAVIDIPGASIIDAFEWAADPDGDPNTIDDVPDVINHSWGVSNTSIGCNDYFWKVIDNTEALGIVNIFAAGNSGYRAMTIVNPANRAFDSLDCFAVGNLNMTTDSIENSSSRGPSDCDGLSIKPNVVAPGTSIRTTAPINAYVTAFAGTSAAAPHVAGAVAILRQKAPNATPDQIKEALLKSCERRPFPESSLPNNNYGWGLINISAALDSLSVQINPDPELRIYSFDHPAVNPGETVQGYIYLKNLGSRLANVSAQVTGGSGGLTINTETLDFGTIDYNDTARSMIPFSAAVSDTVTPGVILAVDLNLTGSPGYSKSVMLNIRIGDIPRAGYFTHNTGPLQFTVSNLGQFGFANGSMVPLGYSGFRYFDPYSNDLWEGALMFATDSDHVSDAARNLVQEPDNDFAVSPGGDLISSIPGIRADQETSSLLNDSRAENPIGLEIEQKTFSWTGSPDQGYVILQYSVKNINDTAIGNLFAGLFFDWDIVNYSYNGGGYSALENLGYMYYHGPFDTLSHYRGIAILNQKGLSSLRIRHNPATQPLLYWSESDKFASLTGGISTPGDYWGDYSEIISTGPFILGPGETDTAVFAILGADNLSELKDFAIRAKNRYYNTTDIPYADNNLLPSGFRLEQNYPNPFNPATVISFSISKKCRVKLSVYNILGEKLTDLIDREMTAGNHQVEWDGTSRNGSHLASGIYFYRLTADGTGITKKMMMLK
ncbi:putative Bacillopeptidase F [Candidatus Zixiibacteriota bacterium]|nr:putative Bacillopeptidase F [candidate division Zixibacteria bacterium]